MTRHDAVRAAALSMRIAGLATMLVLAACANQRVAAPARLGLRLAPSALGEAISVQQHLKVERNGHIDELDTALEVDASHIELVGLAFGQRVLTLHYDGKELTSWRHLMLPKQVSAEDVLEDVQLTLWPEAAIAQALPAGWRVEDAGLRRTLYLDDAVVATIAYSALPRWRSGAVFDNVRYKYRLTIETAQ